MTNANARPIAIQTADSIAASLKRDHVRPAVDDEQVDHEQHGDRADEREPGPRGTSRSTKRAAASTGAVTSPSHNGRVGWGTSGLRFDHGGSTEGLPVETKEALAGVFVVEARDLDHALALAQARPDRRWRRRGPAADRLPGAGADRVTATVAASRGGRRRAPSRVGLRARRDGARHARPRPRRGGVQDAYVVGARRLGARRRPAQPRRLADDRRAAQRAGRAAPRPDAAHEAAAAASSAEPAERTNPTTGEPTRSPTTACG